MSDLPERERRVDGLGRVVMVIPTYNEADNLAWIVGRLRAAQPDVDVLVVDDASPDGTGRLADEQHLRALRWELADDDVGARRRKLRTRATVTNFGRERLP